MQTLLIQWRNKHCLAVLLPQTPLKCEQVSKGREMCRDEEWSMEENQRFRQISGKF